MTGGQPPSLKIMLSAPTLGLPTYRALLVQPQEKSALRAPLSKYGKGNVTLVMEEQRGPKREEETTHVGVVLGDLGIWEWGSFRSASLYARSREASLPQVLAGHWPALAFALALRLTHRQPASSLAVYPSRGGHGGCMHDFEVGQNR